MPAAFCDALLFNLILFRVVLYPFSVKEVKTQSSDCPFYRVAILTMHHQDKSSCHNDLNLKKCNMF